VRFIRQAEKKDLEPLGYTVHRWVLWGKVRLLRSILI
jgi:hypothetical protein